jgi:anti-anti-sigma factor
MKIIRNQVAGCEVLSISGKLDVTNAQKFQKALTEAMASTKSLELDFDGVEYISSAGLRVLLLGQKNAQATGKTLAIKNVSAEVMEVFNITGLTRILTFKENT